MKEKEKELKAEMEAKLQILKKIAVLRFGNKHMYEISKKTGYSKPILSYFFRMTYNPNFKKLIKIADALDLDIEFKDRGGKDLSIFYEKKQ